MPIRGPRGGAATSNGAGVTLAQMNAAIRAAVGRRLRSLAAAPAVAGYSVGDVVDVGGELLVLLSGDDQANVLRGLAADGVDSYVGVDAIEGGAANYGAFADGAWRGEVSWYSVGGGGSASWRIRLPEAALGNAPPARIYGIFIDENHGQTDIIADRDAGRDTTGIWAYATGNDDARPETTAGQHFVLTLYSTDPFQGSAGTALDVHHVHRWEKVALIAGPDAPPTQAQIYALLKRIVRGGSGITLTPDDAADELSIAADGGQGQQSPGTGADGFSRGAAAPAAPVRGDVWSDTTTNKVRRRTGAGWEDLATETYADAGDTVNLAAIDNLATTVVRRAQWARAWIRAADQAAALAGVGAATWTNQGAGTAPTGAHWSVADVPAGADPLWEITALVSPTVGSSSAWAFGSWAAFQITATNTQYSVDGSSAWHAVRAGADQYERHRRVGEGWGPAIPLYAADELAWTRLLEQTAIHQTTRWLPGILWELPATINFTRVDLMRFRLLASTTVPVLEGDAIVRPDYLVADVHADRASSSVESAFVWQLRLSADGLRVVKGSPPLGQGPSGDASDVGLSLVWYRPSGVTSASEARYLRVVYLRNLNVSHRLSVEAI